MGIGIWMYSMSRMGFLPSVFGMVDVKYGTPKNAMIFFIIISLSGPILGREALGWFVDMSAIGASIGFLATSASTIVTMKRNHDRNFLMKVIAILGATFSILFIVLQLIPIPELTGVHFGKESYLMFFVWVVLGVIFFVHQRNQFRTIE